ncbi:YdhK family protein [Paenibacillus sp. MMO-58]|uniref:YdhK family protein n=1 Tax=Paenibacillus sp. MMO-58 TaxID=3081290 RepID=UPI00301973A2
MKKSFIVIGIAAVIALSGCNGNTNNQGKANNNNNQQETNTGMDGMNHSGSSEAPKGLTEAKNPKFEVGSQAIIEAEHMPGMNKATATIVGAYDTTVYAVSYTPTTGGERVTNHKWVIQEDIKDSDDQPYKPGDEVVLNVEHMPGMKGATATIDSAEQTTIYMVDYTPTTGGKPVKNHQWLTESELSAK